MAGVKVCGVDEAGRGPLCGSVVAAAVILDPMCPIEGLADSKKLGARARERLAGLIRQRALAWGVAEATVEEIDRFNILQASLLAMQRAIAALSITPDEVWVDGNHCPDITLPVWAIVGGDALEPAISAASILAKTVRDAQMIELDRLHPQFGLARHKGYPTAAHLEAIRRYGVTDFYRKSFAPVRQVLANPLLCAGG
ncbi:MAG: ribonuclease HII [Betaproteobacteria bacterium]|nr:ribonuclease HII [Betaproteobacteria bacterium]